MSNIWFVFQNNGNFLFKTTQETTLSLIPPNYTSPIIIKNPPGYNPDIDQVTTYDLATSSVVFTTATTLDSIGSTDVTGPIEIVDHKKIQEDLLAAQNNIVLLQTKVADLEGIINAVFPET